jgi:pyridoxamine 5'-phosphate oxidase
MTKAEIIEFLNANPTCYLATSQNNKPYVRAVRMYRADEKGIILATVDGKDLAIQMKENPNIEICFYNAEINVQIRVSGKATLLEDLGLRKEIVEQRPFLKPLVDQKGYGAILVFRVADCAAYVWSMQTNLLPKEYMRF